MLARTIALCFAVSLVACASVTIHNSKDINSGSSPGGTSCGHQNQYNLIGQARGALLIGFPIGDLSSSSSVQFYAKGQRCVNANRITFAVSTIKDASATFEEIASGINDQCPFLETDVRTEYTISSDSDCLGSAVDVTAAFNAAKSAGNAQLVLSHFDNTNTGDVNFCNRFVTPNQDPFYNDNSNCGVLANSREYNIASTFYIVVEQDDSATCAPCPCGSSSGKRRSGCPVCNICTEPPVEGTCAPCPCGSQAGKRRSGCPVCLPCTTEPPVQQTPEPTCVPCPCGSSSGKRRSGCPVCLPCTTEPPVEQTPEPTCAPCPCGSQAGKRRSGCPVCLPCTTEPPVEQTPEPTCAPCPCGSQSGKRRSGCPVCLPCTTEPPVEQTPEPTCAPCPCGSQSGKRRSGCPVCLPCTTTEAPTTTCVPCPCGSSSGKRRTGCPVCLPCPTSSCDLTIYNSKDLRSGSSPGGTACSHSSTGYDLTGNSRGPLYAGFPIGNIDSASRAIFYFKGSNCVNANRLVNTVATVADASATFGEEGGINDACPFINPQSATQLTLDENCLSQGVDVTAAVNAARSAGNSQLVLNIFSSTAVDTTNFCNRFVNPGVEPHFDDNSNCGVHADSRESNPSSFYIVVSPTTCPTTAAPTTEPPVEQTPEPTCAPCPCGSQAGKRRSGCPVCLPCTTEPPVQNTPEPTCAPCPCGSKAGKRRSGCPVCLPCTTEPPVQNTPEPTCAACPCGSQAGKRRTGCPVCLPCNCWTCAAGWKHWYDIPNYPQPADKCACVKETAAPTTTGHNCWTCPSGFVHWYDIPNSKQPDDKCACVPKPTTAAPTNSGAPGENISGENNAKSADSSATSVASVAGVVVAVAIVALL